MARWLEKAARPWGGRSPWEMKSRMQIEDRLLRAVIGRGAPTRCIVALCALLGVACNSVVEGKMEPLSKIKIEEPKQ